MIALPLAIFAAFFAFVGGVVAARHNPAAPPPPQVITVQVSQKPEAPPPPDKRSTCRTLGGTYRRGKCWRVSEIDLSGGGE